MRTRRLATSLALAFSACVLLALATMGGAQAQSDTVLILRGVDARNATDVKVDFIWTGPEGDVITLQDVFLFDFGMGIDEHGRFKGHLTATGVRPKFAEKLADLGIRLGPEVFQPEQFARRAAGAR